MDPKIVPPSKKITSIELIKGKDLSGKVSLITGANTGIGYEAARALAIANCNVFIACRNAESAQEAKENIIKEHPSAQVSILPLDLMDLSSVRLCAQLFLDTGLPLHLLILNAGVLNPTQRITKDGFETTFQVNHLSQFLLTQLLMDKLLASAPAKVVAVSSDAHRTIRSMTPENITREKYSPDEQHMNPGFTAYGLSKFCNILFAKELSRLYEDKGVTAFSLHPGVVRTQVFRNPGFFTSFMRLGKMFMKTPEHGAATTVYLAVTEGLESLSGEYFSDCRKVETTNPSKDLQNTEALWKLSETLIEECKTK